MFRLKEVNEEKVHHGESTRGNNFLCLEQLRGVGIEGAQLSYSRTSQNIKDLWLGESAWSMKAEQLSSEGVSTSAHFRQQLCYSHEGKGGKMQRQNFS